MHACCLKNAKDISKGFTSTHMFRPLALIVSEDKLVDRGQVELGTGRDLTASFGAE
jgi:hypothetical protein